MSRAQVAAIRGVNVDGVMRTLQQRGYIAELARDPGPGQAVLFGTTSLFLERLGLDTLDDLPALGEFVPSSEIVEALETGLRIDGLDDEVSAESEPVPDGGAADVSPRVPDGEAADETEPVLDAADPVIDLREPLVSAAPPAGPTGDVEPLDAVEILADGPVVRDVAADEPAT